MLVTPRSKRGSFVVALVAAYAAAASLLALAPPALAAPADYTSSKVLVSDNFQRTSDAGWGSTSSGAAYASTSMSPLKVVDGKGTIRLNSGQGVTSTLPGVTSTDGLADVSVRIGELPSASHGVYTSLRQRASGGGFYSSTMRVDKDGKIALKIERSTASGLTVLLADKLVLEGAKAGTSYRFQFQATGSTVVELAARVWMSGGSTPGWQGVVTDSGSGRIANGGYAGISSYLSSKAAAMSIAYDEFSLSAVTSKSAPTSPEEPAPPAPEPAPPVGTTGNVGSLPMGAAQYPVPSAAFFVAPLGTSAGTGTKADPYGSLGVALQKVATGATIVLRAGTYHESVEVPFYKKLVVQAYPGEKVWFDGASTLSNWSASGSTWQTGWGYAFDHKVSFSKGKDETSWWVNSKYPMAGYPEQVWIDGVAQTQVRNASEVAVGKFFVDSATKRLVIGVNPSGRRVEASTLQKAITVHGAGSTLRGFGIKRYATTMSQFGAISVEVDDVSLENMIITQNSTIGLFSWGQRPIFNKLTLTHNGSLGAGFNSSTGVTVKNSDVSFNNAERFNQAPVAAGIKTSKVTNSTFVGNLFEGNVDSAGLWIDEKGKNITIAGNRFTRNGTDGLGVEISVSLRIVNNVANENGGSGVRVFDAQNVEVWNNTVVGNVRDSLRIMQDDGRPGQWDILYVNKAVSVRNNVVAFGSTGCPLVVMDTMSKMTGNQMGTSLAGNVYHRASVSSPSTFICWANGSAGLAQYKNLASFRTATGQDAQSMEMIGAPIVAGDYTLTKAVMSSTATVPVVVTQTVADLMGVGPGWKGVGAIGPNLSR